MFLEQVVEGSMNRQRLALRTCKTQTSRRIFLFAGLQSRSSSLKEYANEVDFENLISIVH